MDNLGRSSSYMKSGSGANVGGMHQTQLVVGLALSPWNYVSDQREFYCYRIHLISVWNVAANVGLCVERWLVLSFRNRCFLHVDVQIIGLIKLCNSQKENVFLLLIFLCCTF